MRRSLTLAQAWRVARPFSLPATLVPVLVGAAAAWAGGAPISLPLLAAMLAVALLLQIGTNAANEYFDFRHGLDDSDSIGIAGVLVHGETAPEAVGTMAVACFAAAVAGGCLLVAARGWPLLPLGLGALALGVLYSAGPRPLAGTPLSEALVFLAMGPAEVLASELACSGRWTALGADASIPVGCTVAAILMANNLRDLQRDAARGRRTLAVLLGRARALPLLTGLVLAAFVWSVAGVLWRHIPFPVLGALLAAPSALAALRRAWRIGPNAVPAFGRLHLWFGLLLAAGLLLSRGPGMGG
jgi:1,4-dihydroxy-2-naphthoate octaprenyltransferase